MSAINRTEAPAELPKKYPHELWSISYAVPNSYHKLFEKWASSACESSDDFNDHCHYNLFNPCQKPTPPLACPENDIKKAVHQNFNTISGIAQRSSLNSLESLLLGP